jgi:hypothetical protein
MTSWLLLDAIAIVSGLTPMIDWDLDSYNEYGRLGVYEPPQGALVTAPLVSPGSIKATEEDGVGVWELMLDVLLFWPGTSTTTRCARSSEWRSIGRGQETNDISIEGTTME